MKDIVVTDEVLHKIARKGMPRGWRQVIDMEPDGKGGVTPVGKLAPPGTEPLMRDPRTGEVRWKPEFQPGSARTESIVLPPPPPEVRTTARAKYQALIQVLTHEAIRFTRPDGSVAWPLSVQRDLDEAAWKLGSPGRLTREEQVELLARNYIVWQANKEKENESRRVTTGFHGHYTA